MVNKDEQLTNESSTADNSPHWSKTTKVIVVIFVLLAIVWLMGRFKSLIGMLVIAAILSYLLEPIIGFIGRRTTIRRGLIIVFVYITLALVVIGGFFALGLATFDQVSNLITLLPDLIESGTETISTFITRSEPAQIGPFVINPNVVPWEQITDQLLGMLDPVFSQSTTVVTRLATSTARTVFNVVFIFIISLYLEHDLPNFGGYIKNFAQRPGYRADAERLLPELSHVWRAYLRGQIILGLVIFLVVWIGLTLLGVQNSLALGLLGGLLEFVPTLGPVISAGVAILVAFFQPSNYLGLGAWQFALAVLILMIAIQQLENNFLVPRIVGGALDLHPVLVIVGVFMGAALAGVLGAILAAPIVASLKVLGHYAWRKLFDLPPFPDHVPIEEAPPEELPSSVIRVE